MWEWEKTRGSREKGREFCEYLSVMCVFTHTPAIRRSGWPTPPMLPKGSLRAGRFWGSVLLPITYCCCKSEPNHSLCVREHGSLWFHPHQVMTQFVSWNTCVFWCFDVTGFIGIPFSLFIVHYCLKGSKLQSPDSCKREWERQREKVRERESNHPGLGMISAVLWEGMKLRPSSQLHSKFAEKRKFEKHLGVRSSLHWSSAEGYDIQVQDIKDHDKSRFFPEKGWNLDRKFQIQLQILWVWSWEKKIAALEHQAPVNLLDWRKQNGGSS